MKMRLVTDPRSIVIRAHAFSLQRDSLVRNVVQTTDRDYQTYIRFMWSEWVQHSGHMRSQNLANMWQTSKWPKCTRRYWSVGILSRKIYWTNKFKWFSRNKFLVFQTDGCHRMHVNNLYGIGHFHFSLSYNLELRQWTVSYVGTVSVFKRNQANCPWAVSSVCLSLGNRETLYSCLILITNLSISEGNRCLFNAPSLWAVNFSTALKVFSSNWAINIDTQTWPV